MFIYNMKTVWFLLYSLTLITLIYGDGEMKGKENVGGHPRQIENPSTKSTTVPGIKPSLQPSTPRNTVSCEPTTPSSTTTCEPSTPSRTTTAPIQETTSTQESTTTTTVDGPTTATITLNVPVTSSPSEFYTSTSDCSLLNDGTILLDVRHCRRYYVCHRGLARRMRCPLGQWYDSDVRSCRDRRFVSSCAVSRN
uniref:Chitin-binding type-2 domain-containing protein n=1 Tax=Glossina austeni TaxID=7395 RepID=A0A1A9UDY3_GLOAU